MSENEPSIILNIIKLVGAMFCCLIIAGVITSLIPQSPPEYINLGIKELKNYELVVDTEVGARSRSTERYGVLYFTDGTVYEAQRNCIDIKPITIGGTYNITYIKDADHLDKYSCWNVYHLSLSTNHRQDEGEAQ